MHAMILKVLTSCKNEMHTSHHRGTDLRWDVGQLRSVSEEPNEHVTLTTRVVLLRLLASVDLVT